jgi:Rad4 beta-hairpin domain 3
MKVSYVNAEKMEASKKEPERGTEMTTLRIANSYGNVDVRNGLSQAYRQIKGKRLQPLCRKLGIKFAEALVGFEENGSYYRPIVDGVVVSARSAPKLLEAITARNKRTQSPAALARKKKAQQIKKTAQRIKDAKEQQRAARCVKLGIDPDGHTAQRLNDGHIDEDLAELDGFKARYRHKHTNYDQCFDDEEYHHLRSIGLSPQEIKAEMRAQARMTKQDDPIPPTWRKYLKKYRFVSPVAKALASVLRSTDACHPAWFKEAEIAVRRAGLPLDSLSYNAIKQVIDQWRGERSADQLHAGDRTTRYR